MGIAGRKMPRGENRKLQSNSIRNEVYVYYTKGYDTSEVAKKLNCTQRTIQRHYKYFKNKNY